MTNKFRFKVEKLIRDKLPEFMRSKGIDVFEYQLEGVDYLNSLKDKLVEEAYEVKVATGTDELTEELADVIEVLETIAQANNISMETVRDYKVKKKAKSGGFGNRIYNPFVEIEKSNPAIEYYLNRPKQYPVVHDNIDDNILEELKSREPIFHHPNKFGRTKQDIMEQICDEFWEVGASGNIYTKQEVIEILIERYKDQNYHDIWETLDFELIQIAPDNYLMTYTLIQNKTRRTRRSTIWRKCNSQWKALYHQGTIIESDKV